MSKEQGEADKSLQFGTDPSKKEVILEYSSSASVEIDPRHDTSGLQRKVVGKVDMVVLPFLACTTFLQLLDKNCLSYAALYGLKEDLNLVGQEYSWLATGFYIGYLVMQIPVFLFLPKVKKLPQFMSLMLITWGGLLMCLAACKNFAGFCAVRFFLGAFEAAIQPCSIIISSTWYTKREQPLRMAIWFNTFAGIFNGIFGYAFGHWNTKLPIWKDMFLVYGAVTVAFGLLTFFVIPANIESAWFLNKEEKDCLITRVAANQTGVHFGLKKVVWSHVAECVKDPKYWLLVGIIIVQNFVNAGITNFNTFIIKGFGFLNYRTMLLATPQAGVAMVASLSVTAIVYFVQRVRCVLICFTTAVTLAGVVMIWKVSPEQNRVACLAGTYIAGFYNAPYVLTLSLFSSNTSGDTKKAFVSVSVGLFYALGNLIGPQFFLDSEKPKYSTGIKALVSSCVIMIGFISAYAFLCVIENRKRDSESAQHAIEEKDLREIGEEVDKENLTDVQNRHFRYVF